jgi:hypothetical protein
LRARNLVIALTIDPLDGLDRSAEAPDLRRAGRSLTEPAIQELYRDYVLAVARLVEPDYLGLAAEVNQVEIYGSKAVYAAVAETVSRVALDLDLLHRGLPVYVSVQVDTAWGKDGNPGSYRGVGTTLGDFSGIHVLGLSTFPLLGWDRPESIPDDYFDRLVKEAGIPGLVVESGWPSSWSRAATSLEMQAAWIRRLAQLSDRARLVFVGQIFFSDLDSEIPVPPGSFLEYFVRIGLVDEDFNSKPALEVWDEIFARPLS